MTRAIVLAGGLGTRLRSAVPDLPKPMAPVAGRPFLEHLLDQWIAQGVSHFVLSVGYRHEVIVDHFGDRYRGADVSYAIENTPLGTGGGLLLAARSLPPGDSERFLVLNGDTYFDVPLAPLREFAERTDADWCFSLFKAQETGRYMGLKVDDEHRIVALRHDDQRIGRLANGGVYLVHPRALRGGFVPVEGASVSLENDLFAAWMAGGQRFLGKPFDGAFIDIGVPDDFRRAAEVLPARLPQAPYGTDHAARD